MAGQPVSAFYDSFPLSGGRPFTYTKQLLSIHPDKGKTAGLNMEID